MALRTSEACRTELPNQRNQKQMQFIVGVNFISHAVEGTKSGQCVTFYFASNTLQSTFIWTFERDGFSSTPVLRSFVATQNCSRTADTGDSNCAILQVFTACPNCGLLELNYV